MKAIVANIPWIPPKAYEKPEILEVIMEVFKIYKYGGVELVDPKMLSYFKSIIPKILKNIVKSIFNGISIFAISMPIEVFEKRTEIMR